MKGLLLAAMLMSGMAQEYQLMNRSMLTAQAVCEDKASIVSVINNIQACSRTQETSDSNMIIEAIVPLSRSKPDYFSPQTKLHAKFDVKANKTDRPFVEIYIDNLRFSKITAFAGSEEGSEYIYSRKLTNSDADKELVNKVLDWLLDYAQRYAYGQSTH